MGGKRRGLADGGRRLLPGEHRGGRSRRAGEHHPRRRRGVRDGRQLHHPPLPWRPGLRGPPRRLPAELPLRSRRGRQARSPSWPPTRRPRFPGPPPPPTSPAPACTPLRADRRAACTTPSRRPWGRPTRISVAHPWTSRSPSGATSSSTCATITTPRGSRGAPPSSRSNEDQRLQALRYAFPTAHVDALYRHGAATTSTRCSARPDAAGERYRQWALSPTGAIGLMQVMPRTGRAWPRSWGSPLLPRSARGPLDQRSLRRVVPVAPARPFRRRVPARRWPPTTAARTTSPRGSARGARTSAWTTTSSRSPTPRRGTT